MSLMHNYLLFSMVGLKSEIFAFIAENFTVEVLLQNFWTTLYVPSFWGKSTLSGNSLSLNPIEKLRGIVKTQLTEAESCSSVEQLTAMTNSTWANILLSALRNLVSGLSLRSWKC